MRLYSYYTPQYEVFAKRWFLSSITDGYDTSIEEMHPRHEGGAYLSEAWKAVNRRKINIILRAIEENWGGAFVYSDIDVQFFGKTEGIMLEYIRENDIAAQRDAHEDFDVSLSSGFSGHLCAGLFVCRANKKTRGLWKAVKQYCAINKDRHDQHGLNFYLNNFSGRMRENMFNVKWDYLPESFYSPGPHLDKLSWSEGDALNVPVGILTHHANWTQGINNKVTQLEAVRKIMDSRK